MFHLSRLQRGNILFSSFSGKSEVEIQSSTLERLLEALDVRHLAGWYHPAMRLQEHLNVVQGGNAELRSQIKLLRYFFMLKLHIIAIRFSSKISRRK